MRSASRPRAKARGLRLCGFWLVWRGALLRAKSKHEQKCDYLLRRSPTAYSANFLFSRRSNEVGWMPRIRAACVLLFPVAASTWSM